MKYVSIAMLIANVLAGSAWAQTATAGADVATGQAVAFDRSKGNCLACHAIAGGSLAGNVGPALQNMKILMPDPKQLYAVIYNEQARNPTTIMPPFGKNGILSADEINDIVAYLYTK